MTRLQTLVKNVTVVRPDAPGADDGEQLDLGIVDGRGFVAFPGVVDAHQHRGIYNPLGEDATTESRACAQGGVTTALTYLVRPQDEVRVVHSDLDGPFVAVTGGEGLLQAVIRVDATRPLLPYRKLLLDGAAWEDLSVGAA